MNEGIQSGFAMAAIGLAGTVAGLFFSWLRDRDKLNAGTEIVNIKAQNTVQAAQIADLTAGNARCEAKHQECEARTQTHEQKINELVNAVIRMGGGSGLHTPLRPYDPDPPAK